MTEILTVECEKLSIQVGNKILRLKSRLYLMHLIRELISLPMTGQRVFRPLRRRDIQIQFTCKCENWMNPN